LSSNATVVSRISGATGFVGGLKPGTIIFCNIYMQNTGSILMTIITLTRQFLNCWLEYVLSQPVDFDISVMLHFTKSYLGIPVFLSLFKKDDSIVTDEFIQTENEELVPELIPQKSYS
jgi:hypothetical protein